MAKAKVKTCSKAKATASLKNPRRPTIRLCIVFHKGAELKEVTDSFWVRETIEKIIITAAAGSEDGPFLAWFDNLNLEPHATPLGVNMVHGDVVDVFAINDQMDPSAEFSLPNRPRLKKSIDIGANMLHLHPMPIIYSGVLLPHDHHPSEESAQACREVLDCIRMYLFPALDKTISSFRHLPDQLPDFSPILSKLARHSYPHAADCFREVYKVMSSKDKSVRTAKSRTQAHYRCMLMNDLTKTLYDFQQAVQSYQAAGGSRCQGETGFDRFWESRTYVDKKFKDVHIYVGPVRDLDEKAGYIAPPTFILYGLSESTKVSHLLNSFCFHMNAGDSFIYFYDVFCMNSIPGTCKRIDKNTLVLELIPSLVRGAKWNRFHLAFHILHLTEETRAVDDLLAFIENPRENSSGSSGINSEQQIQVGPI
jgi:hypothetical protein